MERRAPSPLCFLRALSGFLRFSLPSKQICSLLEFQRATVNSVYILSAVRTPIGVVAAKAAIERAGLEPQQVEERAVVAASRRHRRISSTCGGLSGN